VSIQHAYEVLTGRRQAPSGVHTRNQVNNWEFQDWFWGFTASRRWAAQHHARPAGEGGGGAARAPQERAVLNSQLAGLRQRAAIRHTKAARGGGGGAAAEEPEQEHAQQQHQQQQQQQHHHHHHHHHAAAAAAAHGAPWAAAQAHGGPHAAAPEPGPRFRPPPLAVDYDTTAMSDGVNMAAGVGYDPWSPEAAAAAARPRFTATESVKSQVVGQLGGLKRRAAVKQRADAETEARARAAAAGGPAGSGGGGGGCGDGQGHTAVDDDPWSV
jgi:hypothetical protein